MIHIVVFCYVFAIIVAVSALTIQWLAYKGRDEKQRRPMTPLVTMLVILNLYDLLFITQITSPITLTTLSSSVWETA